MFDPIKTAKTVATNYIAKKGYAAYQAAASGIGITSWRDMDEDDALKLCKALGHGAMFAHSPRRRPR